MRTKIQPPTHPPQRGNSTQTQPNRSWPMVKQRGMYQAKPPEQWLICWVKRGQPPPFWSLKSRRPPSEADLPEKITQLQGQFYHGLSSFPAELNKRWRVLKWLRHLLQWVGDSSGFRKNSGFFLAHRPIFQTVFSFDYSCFHFIWFPLSKIRSIKFKLYCGLVKHSNTQRSLYWMQAICWGSLSAKHRLTKAARLTVLSHATVEHFPCLQLAIQDFFRLWMWLTAQRLLDTRAQRHKQAALVVQNVILKEPLNMWVWYLLFTSTRNMARHG